VITATQPHFSNLLICTSVGATCKRIFHSTQTFLATRGSSRSHKCWDGKANAVLCKLYHSVGTKRELSNAAKLSVFKSIFFPILTYDHESWVMTEGVQSQVQAAEMGFLPKHDGVTLRDKVRSCEISKALNVEPLLFRKERSQLRWFDQVTRMPQKRLARQVVLAALTGKRPRTPGPEVQESCEVTASPTLFDLVLVWSQQNYTRLLLTVRSPPGNASPLPSVKENASKK